MSEAAPLPQALENPLLPAQTLLSQEPRTGSYTAESAFRSGTFNQRLNALAQLILAYPSADADLLAEAIRGMEAAAENRTNLLVGPDDF